jgi:secreted PhoX family phosphatase
MSYLTDQARAAAAAARTTTANANPVVPGQMFDDVLARAQVKRRSMLRGGLGASIAALFGSTSLVACGGGGDDGFLPSPGPVPAPAPDFGVNFARIAANQLDTVTVPESYSVQVLFAAGDAVDGGTSFTGSFLSSAEAETVAGGNHDGMHFYPLAGVDPNRGGLLAINHELPDYQILMSGTYNAATATPEQKRIALSAVGVSVIEVERGGNGAWAVKAGSRYNRRYTGNTFYKVSGPAATAVGPTVVGTLNNCSSGPTPWGTYLTCEESTDNYLDPTQADEGYGWVVEIDPYGELAGMPVKRTALGRFDHENAAFMLDADNNVAIYLGDDGTPGCIYKFVPSAKYNPNDRAANANLLDSGTLYAAKFNADGTGQWIALVQGQNNLVTGATDPGNETQGAQPDVTIDFNTQADVLINTKAAARVAGATLMDRPEWITVGPDKTLYCTLTNNSGRQVTDAANPRVTNRHGHIIKWNEAGDVPTATTFNWEVFLMAGDPTLAAGGDNLVGNISGDTFSAPDGLRVDPEGRLWVQTDMSVPGSSGASGITNVAAFGHNAMYNVDPQTKASRRFLVGPVGCEITGLAYTPDLKTFFINIQHPSGKWPSPEGSTLPPRSATIVVSRADGKPVGA